MNDKIVVLPAKWHPKRTYPRKKVPKNVIQFPDVMTLSRKILLDLLKREAKGNVRC